MIRHVVMFRFAATDPAQQQSDLDAMRERLSALVGTIPGLTSMSVGRDLGRIENHLDVALMSEHDSIEALEAYQVHPAHQEVAVFIRSVTSADRYTVDYEA